MLSTNDLYKAWDQAGRFLSPHSRMRLTEDGLTLGASTVIAPLGRDEWERPILKIDGNEERILALLSIAHDQPILPNVLGNLRNASRCLCKGELVLAYIHLAFTGLQPVEDTDAPRRLFMAKMLLDDGVRGNELRKAWGLGKYNPNHYPSGSSRGGQFAPRDSTDGNAPQQVSTTQEHFILASAQGDDTTAKKERFVDTHLADAQRIAEKLGVPVENILGLSALESGWGVRIQAPDLPLKPTIS